MEQPKLTLDVNTPDQRTLHEAYTLYGAELSYFSAKARSYLRWKRIPFEERNPDLAYYQDVCIPRVGRPVIPLLILPNGDEIQDTTLIIEHFESEAGLDPVLTPEGPVQQLVASLLELYADNWLLIPAMHYRWEYETEIMLLEFGMNLAPDASPEKQYRLGEASAKPFRRAASLLGVSAENKATVEALWAESLSEFDAHFRTMPYLLGDKPCVADFSLVGALYAHMYRDTQAGSQLRREALSVARYVERMLQPSSRNLGAYLNDDDIPDTLLPILRRMMKEQMPSLVDTTVRLRQWKQDHPEDDIPQTIGFHPFDLGGVASERAVFVYPVWMFNRSRAHYEQLQGRDRLRADELLQHCDGELFRDAAILTPMTLTDHVLRWEEEPSRDESGKG